MTEARTIAVQTLTEFSREAAVASMKLENRSLPSEYSRSQTTAALLSDLRRARGWD
ncbi:hypothetical protein [Corynebacterium haemomassiliense]|uniref:Uncharacterized protein n=1 Tax=Corynebacterium haemomassiliense TaxID=2754726 RepID=A0A7W2E9F6_9CORY|nr:hypothetical protein [Corynebacterium haemomassiliense]MBA5243532.1 hypothetical protein [Corynebacterium haemomassiliense]